MVALPIARRMRIEIVLPAVHLDDELVGQTDETNNEAVARRLRAKMKAARTP